MKVKRKRRERHQIGVRPGMKAEPEIQRAHDLIQGIIMGHIPGVLDELSPEKILTLNTTMNVLCWVLGHEHNDSFAKGILNLEAFLLGRGYALVNERPRPGPR